mmetsp:Transcript_6706/g.8875  ORF Transcript_6706/g.8875 Transcript_6706/m.8875 type:complete len:226 (+) Transcript_6706:324-1001(+)
MGHDQAVLIKQQTKGKVRGVYNVWSTRLRHRAARYDVHHLRSKRNGQGRKKRRRSTVRHRRKDVGMASRHAGIRLGHGKQERHRGRRRRGGVRLRSLRPRRRMEETAIVLADGHARSKGRERVPAGDYRGGAAGQRCGSGACAGCERVPELHGLRHVLLLHVRCADENGGDGGLVRSGSAGEKCGERTIRERCPGRLREDQRDEHVPQRVSHGQVPALVQNVHVP